MQSVWKTSILFTIVTTVLLGLGYPLLITGIAAVIFPHKAADILLRNNLLVYGVGGIIVPFIGIKAIDLCLVALHLA